MHSVIMTPLHDFFIVNKLKETFLSNATYSLLYWHYVKSGNSYFCFAIFSMKMQANEKFYKMYISNFVAKSH